MRFSDHQKLTSYKHQLIMTSSASLVAALISAMAVVCSGQDCCARTEPIEALYDGVFLMKDIASNAVSIIIIAIIMSSSE